MLTKLHIHETVDGRFEIFPRPNEKTVEIEVSYLEAKYISETISAITFIEYTLMKKIEEKRKNA